VACHCGRHSLSGLPLTPAYSTACHCHTGLPFRRFTACICHTGSHFPSHCMPLPASLAPILPTYCHTGSHFPSLCMIWVPHWLSFPNPLHATATLALMSHPTACHCHTGLPFSRSSLCMILPHRLLLYFPSHCLPLPHWAPILPMWACASLCLPLPHWLFNTCHCHTATLAFQYMPLPPCHPAPASTRPSPHHPVSRPSSCLASTSCLTLVSIHGSPRPTGTRRWGLLRGSTGGSRGGW
jgi:hypothetical protein